MAASRSRSTSCTAATNGSSRCWRPTVSIAAYTVRSVGRTAAGDEVTRVARFATADLSLAEQTYASIAPLDGETVGVGMPVVVTFDVPVTDRAEFERHMHVQSTPARRAPGTG